MKLQSSSCKKQPSKSSRALKHNSSKERRKSTSSLKCDDSEAWHQKANCLHSEDLKHENSSLKHNISNNMLKQAKQCEFGTLSLENEHVNKERLSREDQKCDETGAGKSSDIFTCSSF